MLNNLIFVKYQYQSNHQCYKVNSGEIIKFCGDKSSLINGDVLSINF